MRNILVCCCLLILSPSLWAAGPQLPVRTHYGNGQVRLELVPSPDGDDIILRAFDPDGQLTKEEWVQGGALKLDAQGEQCAGNRRDGVVRCEHEGSQTISYYPYRGYLLEGTVRVIGSEGYRRTTYRAGEKQGLDEEVSQYGKHTIRKGRHYVGGELDGKEIEVRDGSLARLRTWRAGKLHGRCVLRSEYMERVGECHGDEAGGFTGVERSYRVDYGTRKGRGGRTVERKTKRLASVRFYKDGEIVKERTIQEGKTAARTVKRERPKKVAPPKPGAGGLLPATICTAIGGAVCERMVACKQDTGGLSAEECTGVFREQLCTAMPAKARDVNQAQLDQCVTAIKQIKCKALQSPNPPAGCEFMQ